MKKNIFLIIITFLQTTHGVGNFQDGRGDCLDATFMEQAIKCAPIGAIGILNGLNRPVEVKRRDLYPRELLFTGAPGTGKTTLGLAFAYKLGYKYRLIDTIQLSNEYKDSGGQNARRSVQSILAEDGNDGWVIIFDEITALTRDHRQEKTDGWKSATALWTLLDKLLLRKNIIVIGTTNDATEMPTALKSRYSDGVIEFEAPSRDNRKNIIEYWHKHYSYDISNDSWLCTLGPGALDVFAEKTEDTSIRDLEKLVKLTIRCSKKLCSNQPEINQQSINQAKARWQYNTSNLLKMNEPQLTEQERLQKENHVFQKELHDVTMAHQVELHNEHIEWSKSLHQENQRLQTELATQSNALQWELHNAQTDWQKALHTVNLELQKQQYEENSNVLKDNHDHDIAFQVKNTLWQLDHSRCGWDRASPCYCNGGNIPAQYKKEMTKEFLDSYQSKK